MHLRTALSVFALAASLPAAAQAQSVNDFSLENLGTPTPTPTPQAQGPADVQSGVAIVPRAVNTPTPTPRPAASPAPTPTPSATATQAPASIATPRATPLPSVTPRTVETAPRQPEAQLSPAPTPTPTPIATATAAGTGSSPLALPTGMPVAEEPGEDLPWLPIGLGAALLALLGAGFALWKRRSDAAVPEIERPVVPREPAAAPLAAMADAVQIRLEYDKLIRSAAFATVKYRMTLVNRTDAALTDLVVGMDLVSAHAAAPMEEQVATPSTALETRHTLERMAPRQSVVVDGQVQLPLAGVNVIHQGRFPLLVPLLRVRIDGPGEGALVKTFVVGLGAPGGGRVQPIRLDEGPRSYAPIAQRELA
ncbi:hypothetical protein [Qipengyuania flava]|uniref:hypothetical protein n=1 Tax=Qipengyuania flava TaxID=192812 RepID=UPI001C62E639|nr:hypothetical protein [Qipengyuania flava]QYJ06717.1 hypothetical protein KUV82_11715 [Qipengyuania flava]